MKLVRARDLDESFFEPAQDALPDVSGIISAVRQRGDEALFDLSERYDGARPERLEIPRAEWEAARRSLDRETGRALRSAAGAIRDFARWQMTQVQPFSVTRRGVTVGQVVRPIDRAGCYVPGGRYPLPSTALMTVIPAKVAGVREVIVCCPRPHPAVLAACSLAGAHRLFAAGGAQAIAAMAYGTATIPRCDKIVGPGNRYVTAAKKAVFGRCGIDMLAGPSEVFVIADASADPCLVAADLIAQAEHDPDATAILATDSEALARRVSDCVERQLQDLPTAGVACRSLDHAVAVVCRDLKEAVAVANRRAPEHLELHVESAARLLKRCRSFGAAFVGPYAAEVVGDYCAGPNHTLPTGGAARYTGGLSVRDFLKIQTYEMSTEEGAEALARTAAALAAIEGLEGHRRAALARMGREGEETKGIATGKVP